MNTCQHQFWILELSLGARAFPSAAVAAEAWVSRVRRLQFIGRPWASGALRLIKLGGHDIDMFAAWPALLIALLSGPLLNTLEFISWLWYDVYMLPVLQRCFDVLWTRTRTLGLSLSAMFMLILCLFWGGGGGGGSANLWWVGCLLIVLSVFGVPLWMGSLRLFSLLGCRGVRRQEVRCRAVRRVVSPHSFVGSTIVLRG